MDAEERLLFVFQGQHIHVHEEGFMTVLLRHISVPLSIITELGTANADARMPHRTWASRSWRDNHRYSYWEHFRNASRSWGFGLDNSLHD